MQLYTFKIYNPEGKMILTFNVQARTDFVAMNHYCQREDVQSLEQSDVAKVVIEIISIDTIA